MLLPWFPSWQHAKWKWKDWDSIHQLNGAFGKKCGVYPREGRERARNRANYVSDARNGEPKKRVNPDCPSGVV